MLAGSAWAGWLDTPDRLRLAGIGDEMVVNGTPMEVRSFTAAEPMEQLLDDVRRSWDANPEHRSVVRTKVGTWTVLNQTLGQEHRSFQVREAGGKLEGFVALTSPQRARAPKVAVPLPPQLKPVSVIDSRDNGKLSQQVIAVSGRSADATATALEAALAAQGWKRHVMKRGQGNVLFSANRGGQEFDATISAQQNGALVMMNTVIGNK
jgi:hypothetical protein